MTGIDDLIICPRCLKPMGEKVDTMVCQYCGYNEKEELLMEWILSKMSYYEKIIDNTDGYNNVSAKGHLDMLIKLKKFIEGLE